MGLGDNYRNMLLSLLPRGKAFPRHTESFWYRLMDGLKEELVRLHQRSLDLLEEIDPRTTTELLPDWERVLRLPDDCSPAEIETIERRNQVVGKLVSKGGQSPSYFIGIAKNLGFDVTIDEFRPFTVGGSCVGDDLTNGNWVYVWRINAPEETVTYFTVGQSSCGDGLANWGNDLLECTINKIKPSHTKLLFGYGD